MVTDHDEFVFGGAGGSTVIRSSLHRSWDFHPPILITETRIQGRLVAERPRDALTLRPSENGFAIQARRLAHTGAGFALVSVTVSIGLAPLGADTASLDRLIARADAALYAAKHAGRNRVAAGPHDEIASGAAAPPQWAGVN